jgi:hypothetical protein
VGVKLPFSGFPNVTTGTFVHTFNLNVDLVGITTADFIAGLEAGLAYANIHDTTFPGGEIRDQLMTPLPAALPLFATGLGVVGLFGWRKKRKASVALSS